MYVTYIFVFINLFFANAIAESLDSMNEKQLIVPDKETALLIATAVCKARFGDRFCRKYEPYTDRLEKSVWIIVGTSPDDMARGGGTPEISISAKNGAVLEIQLSR